MIITKQALQQLIDEEFKRAVKARKLSEAGPRNSRYKASQDYNKQILAKHQAIRDQILQLRPHWSPEKLQQVTRMWNNMHDDKGPGLDDILQAIRTMDEMEARFGK